MLKNSCFCVNRQDHPYSMRATCRKGYTSVIIFKCERERKIKFTYLKISNKYFESNFDKQNYYLALFYIYNKISNNKSKYS